MDLPDLAWQFMYGRAAWTAVIAALGAALWQRKATLSRAALLAWVGAMAVLFALPGKASPAYWLILAWQWPSGLLAGLCLAKLYWTWHSRPALPVLPPSLAIPIVLCGALLYAEVSGRISLGFYYWGFSPLSAPVLALILSVACAIAVAQGRARTPAFAMLLAVGLFCILRLPTGNLWDSLFDPLLWCWAIASLATRYGAWRARPRPVD